LITRVTTRSITRIAWITRIINRRIRRRTRSTGIRITGIARYSIHIRIITFISFRLIFSILAS
jgi:hypothetical protein